MAESSGAVHVELRGVPDADAGQRAMEAARSALFAIPHPEEPDDPLPSFATNVSLGDRGPTFWFDIADAEAYDGLIDTVVKKLAAAVEGEVAEATLTWPDGP
jgi:hypothetical protein